MSGTRKVSEVDGFTVVRLAQHAKSRPAPLREAPAVPPPEPTAAPAAPTHSPGDGIEMVCYFCSHAFRVAKRTRLMMCPQCRKPLDQEDFTLKAATASSVHTTGTFRVAEGGQLTGGNVVARDVILEGHVEAGRVRALHLLELAGGTVADESLISGRDLKIAAGTTFRFRKPAAFRNVDVFGRLTADLQATGTVNIHPGGLLSGHVAARHLVVEEGGGLKADLHIGMPG